MFKPKQIQNKNESTSLNEEEDVFLSSLNKRVQNLSKKQKEILDLSNRDPSTLKPEQLEKLKNKERCDLILKEVESIKASYLEHKQNSKIDNSKEAKSNSSSSPINIIKYIPSILNLTHFVEFFKNPADKEDFLKHSKMGLANLDQILEFYDRIFTFQSCLETPLHLKEKIDSSTAELCSYLQNFDKSANSLYSEYYKNVEDIINSDYFTSKQIVILPKRPCLIEGGPLKTLNHNFSEKNNIHPNLHNRKNSKEIIEKLLIEKNIEGDNEEDENKLTTGDENTVSPQNIKKGAHNGKKSIGGGVKKFYPKRKFEDEEKKLVKSEVKKEENKHSSNNNELEGDGFKLVKKKVSKKDVLFRGKGKTRPVDDFSSNTEAI